ncbi:MAG: hypothetical protein JSW58_07280 [Candidatus Latescibacterota bacterium]|nr:MAG: hypothetical protein JSW58_07280 [Candidatus Latescibacterota bacterium]
MKTVFVVVVATVIFALPAAGQPGSIGIFADPGGTDCNLPDTQSGLTSYHIVHVNTPGAVAAQFYAPQPPCLDAMYLSDTFVYALYWGNSQTGIAVSYGTCLSSPIYICAINYFTQGLTEPCCYYPVLPDPAAPSGRIEVVDCNHETVYATGGTGIVNSNLSCTCDVPTKYSTWGKVKALYAE